MLDDLIECPECGHTADMDGFDVLGADGNNVFCNQCHCEFDSQCGGLKTMAEVVMFEQTDWLVERTHNGEPYVAYRRCDLCDQTACDDIWAGEKDSRDFVRQHGGCGDGLNICGNCIDEYLNDEQPL